MSIRLPFFKRKKKPDHPQTAFDKVPHHIAIIMDGNGRWAKKRGLPRIAGHKEGMETVRKIVKAAVDHEIKVLTLYTFSTENWKRPKSEVDFIMRLPKEFLNLYLPELIENNVKIAVIGEFDELPKHTKDAVQYGIEQTKENDGLLLNFALNYGGRDEIVRAVRNMMLDMRENKLSPEHLDLLDGSIFSKYLYTGDLPDPDLVIRTSGEQRLSNFLLWQCAYSEFWFTDTLWPDFDEETFSHALKEYEQRKRRFGGI